MTQSMSPQDLIDKDAYDQSGEKIGRIGSVYLTDDSQRPEWVTIKTGLFGQRESFVPLAGAGTYEDGISVSVSKEAVKDAPKIDSDGHLSEEQSVELYRYYNIRRDSAADQQGETQTAETPRGDEPSAGHGLAAGGHAGAGETTAGQDAAGETTTGRSDMDSSGVGRFGRGQSDPAADAPNTGTPDTATPDTATPDSATPDTATPDSGTPSSPAAEQTSGLAGSGAAGLVGGAAAGGIAGSGAAAGAAGGRHEDTGGLPAGTRERAGTETSRSPASADTAAGSTTPAPPKRATPEPTAPASTPPTGGAGTRETMTPQSAGTAAAAGSPASAGESGTGTGRTGGAASPEPADDENTVVRYEERLNVGTERVERARVRLRKYIVTEEQQVTVTLSREEVSIERLPISESERSGIAAEPLGESEREIILHEDRPVVQTESVPVERVRLRTNAVTEDQQVSGQVRKEQFDIDDPTAQH